MLTYAVSLEENISRNFSKLLDVNNRIGFQRQQFAISKRLIKYDMLLCESKIWRAILGSVKQYLTDIVSILKGVACFQSTCMHFREQTATGKSVISDGYSTVVIYKWDWIGLDLWVEWDVGHHTVLMINWCFEEKAVHCRADTNSLFVASYIVCIAELVSSILAQNATLKKLNTMV